MLSLRVVSKLIHIHGGHLIITESLLLTLSVKATWHYYDPDDVVYGMVGRAGPC